MSDMGGLRERKKAETYRRLSETAVGLFLEHGFERVTVADVAAAAGVSKPTLFRYFPAKEDLVLHRLADHEGEAGAVVAGRAPGSSPLAALRRHFLAGLDRRDPVTGLNDDPGVLAFHALLYGTPSLVARLHTHQERDEAALAEALAPEGPGAGTGAGVEERLAAGQIVAVRRVLAQENWRLIAAGGRADDLAEEAVRVAEAAFDQLCRGLPRLA
ncbi:TetR family transcriptional regulator [Streptomyces koyangensis]|uniref:TetR family transcriptional regulator n=2 Tax=Streptomyces TaxID=1883 RepID=A0A385D7I5_9ACTN|nr:MULTISPECIES: TetR/AcrR family transcriptional regulator [Streptomyces]AXQ54325.1 TetR family transcriptional regulator [Streptomyces koyangensis]PKR45153.1 TetR family transcriptional regulator [Streptomyces sp. EAG2]